jgi:tetratricopeptide (TPR) repeat protein
MKRFAAFLAFAMLFCTLPVSAKDNWVKIKSKHFTLVGNASEKDIRTVGTKLEQFRSVFAQLFPQVRVVSPMPITVLVFKDKKAYRPFMPVWNGKVKEVGGYFLPGPEINYISLAAEFGRIKPYGVIFHVDSPYRIIFHEFVHSLTQDAIAHLPAWLNEGLAEFYSMFEVSDKDTKVELGAPINQHVHHLRAKQFLSLSELFAVHGHSPEYNERDKSGVFCSQAWALVHYLMLGNNGQRRPQLNQFVNLLAASMPMQEAFTKAFQTDFAALETELRNYVKGNSYPVLNYTSKEKFLFDDEMTTEPVSEAEANFHLGDLLAQQRRAEAEQYLQTAVQLDASFAPPYASLGLTRIHSGKFDEAQKYLEKAIAYDKEGRNHLIYYYYAMVLMREGADSNGTQIISPGLEKNKAQQIRTHLQKAIQIRPSFSPAYALLASMNLSVGEQMEETAALLKRALQDAPGQQEMVFQLAQVYLRQQKIEDAKNLLAPMAHNAADVMLKARAQGLLDLMQRLAGQTAQFQAELEAFNKQEPAAGETDLSSARRPTMRRSAERTITEEPPPATEPQTWLRARAAREEEVRGVLTKMECSPQGVTLYVTVGPQTLVFHTQQPARLEFTTFATSGGEAIECKEFTPARPVRMIYRRNTDAAAKYQGEPSTVEFIKP